jgi:hypothetical protein
MNWDEPALVTCAERFAAAVAAGDLEHADRWARIAWVIAEAIAARSVDR